MGNLQKPLELEACRSCVLRLREGLLKLREAIVEVFPEGVSVLQLSKYFEVDWALVKRFWVDNKTAGSTLVNAIKAAQIRPALCDEIVVLLDVVPDHYKSLARYKVGPINLVFDLLVCFSNIRRAVESNNSRRFSVKHFAELFGDDQDFVFQVVNRNYLVLDNYDSVLGLRLTLLMATVNVEELAGSSKYVRVRAAKPAAVIHREPLESKPPDCGLTSDRVPDDKLVPTYEAHQLIGWFISNLNATVHLFAASGVKPEMFTDGHRDSVMSAIKRLAEASGINSQAIKRLQSVSGVAVGDPALQSILSALRGGK